MQRRYLIRTLLSITLSMLVWQCAQVVPLTGGAKDTTPPKLLEASPAMNSTNVKPKEIVLRFDEFVKVQDLANQIIITPRTKNQPEILAEGKKVRILFNEKDLAENTTYRVFFGKAIADMHELNVLQDFDYVFSTGPVIDTLTLGGVVSDAYNTREAANITVGLYEMLAAGDSTIFKEAPLYFCKTGSDGRFSFSNLPARTFSVYAFDDVNKNQLYDGESEKVGFSDEVIQAGKDSLVKIRVFKEEAAKTYVKKIYSPYFGNGRIVLNKRSVVKAVPLDKTLSPFFFDWNPDIERDTVVFSLAETRDTLALLLSYAGVRKADTVKVVMSKKRSVKQKYLSDPQFAFAGMEKGKTALMDFTFLNWMATGSVNKEGITLQVKKDSLRKRFPFTGEWLSPLRYRIKADLRPGLVYEVKTDTTVFMERDGLRNDSLGYTFKLPSESDFGILHVKLKVNRKQKYIVQLVDLNEKVIQERYLGFPLSASNAVTVDFTGVLPGSYQIKVVFDNNENQKWDNGNVLKRKLPEQVYVDGKTLKITPEWEMEEEILLKE